MKVTTFGKWEGQRTILMEQLLSNDAISSLVSQDMLNDALLGPVHTSMHTQAIGFTRANKSMPLRDLLMNSIKQSLLGVLENLSKALSIDEELLAPYVETFCKEAEEAIPGFIDDLLAIEPISVHYKKEALSQLYGETFGELHPDLSRSLMLQDKEISTYAARYIAVKVSEIPFRQSPKFMEEVIKYIGEIASQVGTTAEFEEAFLKETGTTMEAHKKMIAERNSLAGLVCHSLFSSPEGVGVTLRSIPKPYIDTLAHRCVNKLSREGVVLDGGIKTFIDALETGSPVYGSACWGLAHIVAHRPDRCEMIQAAKVIKKLIVEVGRWGTDPETKSDIVLLLSHLTQSKSCCDEICALEGIPIFISFMNRSTNGFIPTKCADALAELSKYPSAQEGIKRAISDGTLDEWCGSSEIVNRYMSKYANEYIKNAISFVLFDLEESISVRATGGYSL